MNYFYTNKLSRHKTEKMKNNTILSILLAGLLMFSNVMAQNMEQGKKFIYAERFNSAKSTFQKVIAADPNNDEAIYWLGQSMIRPDEVSSTNLSEAKSLYQARLNASNSVLMMAGIGHIELMEGNVQDARKHFEAAVSLSQGKNIAVLNAVGFANGNFDSKNGDAIYAIEKLKQATLVKKFNDPDVLVNLGDAYRKTGDGGNAILSYQAALTLDSKFARAEYRIGKIYQSQGKGQESIFMEHYENAINIDPTFAPVYANLFNYYYETDVVKAAAYFEKWLANADQDDKTCYYNASLKYAQGFFMEAINKINECIASSASKPYPKLFGLKANAYNKLKDSIKVIESYAEYFKQQDADKIASRDFVEYALNLLKFPGKEAEAGLLVDKAVTLDSIEPNKVSYLKSIAQAYESQKNFVSAADWYNKIVAVKKNPSKYDINTVGFNYFKGGAYQLSVDAFTLSSVKFPDDPYAFNMIGKSSWAIDSTMEKGMANAAFEKTIQLSLVDSIKYKPQLMNSYKYFVAYYANIMKDKNTALSYVEKALALDPTDAEANSYKAALLSSKTSPAKTPAKKP